MLREDEKVTDDRQQEIDALAAQYRERGDPYGWFEEIYAKAGSDKDRIPWAAKGTNPHLVEWLLRGHQLQGSKALVVGCGLGDDAETLAHQGMQVTAFDVSRSAIAWCKERWPESTVDYRVADLFQAEFEPFDFVLEAHTLQALTPGPVREEAIRRVAAMVGARLLVLARGGEPDDQKAIPWPLTRRELQGFAGAGLREVRFEDFLDARQPPIRRFRVEYAR